MRDDGRGEADERAVRVRTARAADLEAVAAIERRSFTDPWSRRAFAELLARPETYFVVATARESRVGSPSERADVEANEEERDEVLGYAVARFVVPEGEVANIAVHAGRRGRGVGASLLDDVLRAAERRGVTEMFLEVRESNAPARSLYASRGFHVVGRRRQYYRAPLEDALLLRRDLRPRGA